MNKIYIQSIDFINQDVILTLSNTHTYFVSRAFYDLYNFQINQEIPIDIIEILEEYETILQVYKKALYYLSFKDYSEYKLKQKLSTYDTFYIEKVIELLKKKHLINDYEYAYHKFQERIKKNYGLDKIEQDLKQEHINEHDLLIIRESIDRQELYQYAYNYAQSLIDRNHSKSKKALELTLYQKLRSRGYQTSIIEQVCANIEMTVDSEQEKALLEKEYQKVLKRYKNKYTGSLLKNKIIYFLQNKGFNYQEIKEIVEEDNDYFRS